MADKKRIEELRKGVTHPSNMKGKTPSEIPTWIRKKRQAEYEKKEEARAKAAPPPPPKSQGFTEEEEKVFRESTRIPQNINEGLQSLLLMMEGIKKDPEKLAEFHRLVVQEYAGDE
tara:strand:- start:2798 stop:3145 length:348 start_codon:yes stop_codon:yes gene_type:complete